MNTPTKTRYVSAVALNAAHELFELLAPSCLRIEIAGSLRRGSDDVGDIELLCIPHPIPRDEDGRPLALEYVGYTDMLDLTLRQLMTGRNSILRKRMNAKNHPTGYGPLNKYLVHNRSGVPVDIFTATEKNWGMALFVRTGPRDWNIRAMNHLQKIGLRGHVSDYRITFADEEELELEVREEEQVFGHLGVPFVAPEKRR